LVADDCSLNVRLLTVALRAAMGTDSTIVVQKETAEEALRCCEMSKFDCVFVDEDFGCCGMRGSDMIRAVRRRKQGESQSATPCDVPIVSCTSEIDLQPIQAAGATLIWKKPFPPVASIARTLTDLLTANTGNK
jgi:CheY-like chemotaxis protein